MIVLQVEGMSCGNCVAAVTTALTAVCGVEKVVEVSVERKEARVQGSPDPDALVAAIDEAGFDAVVKTS